MNKRVAPLLVGISKARSRLLLATWNVANLGVQERREAFDQGLLKKADAGERWRAGQRPQRKLRRWFFNGARPEPVPSYVGTVEGPFKDRLGICCSGGGIRSAAFSLGALQTLQEENELRRASYLAAVSGGSYIAAAFSMVATAWVDRRDGTPPWESDDSDPEMLKRMPPFAPGSPEEQYLRNRCSYIAPTFTDKVYIAFRILLGMLINLLFISLFLVGVAWLFTGLFLAPQLPELVGDCSAGQKDCAASIPAWFWRAPVAMAAIAIAIGWFGMLVKIGSDSRNRAVQIWAARLLIGSALVAVALVLLPTLVDVLLRPGDEPGDDTTLDIPTTLVSFGSLFAGLVAGVVAQLWRLLRTKEGREGAAKAVKAASKAESGALKAIAYLAGGLLGPLILFAGVVVAVSVGLERSSHGFDNPEAIGAGLAALGLFAGIYRCTDLTTWSLHPYYKRRLATAFALKRANPNDLTDDELNRVEALPSPAADSVGIAVERDFKKNVSLSQTALIDAKKIDENGHEVIERTKWPTLLVCAAANVSDLGATPPGRRVSSFTFSPYTVGGPLTGAIETKKLEAAFKGSAEDSKAAKASERRGRDLTLISAVAMSGAAISPSMGKMTPQPLTLLMALANLRLGVWVPNPRWVEGTDPRADGISEAERKRRRRDRKRHTRPRPSYLFREFFGRNRIDARYLYVTDGGHYENLGLVELLRRGCTQVYCFDASGVGEGRAEFGALGEAIALARSELDVEITFGNDEDPADLQPRGAAGEPRFSTDQVVKGKIRYPDQDRTKGTRTEGTLIYVRNVMTREAPWDAQAYQRTDPRFPNNPTIDQLYTDQKFESYRALGLLAAREACERMGASGAEDVVAGYD